MELIDLFANYFLLLSNDYLLMTISLSLFIFSKQKDHTHLILMLLFSMIYKTILKDVFQSPALSTSPTLNFGFPSGHINFATIFYGWLIITYKSKKLFCLSLAAMILTGWGILHMGYHDKNDLLLTPIFAIILITIYKTFLLKLKKEKILMILMMIALICQLFSIYLIGYVKCDMIIGSYGILGFGLSNAIHTHQYKNLLLPIGFLVLFFIISETSMQFIKNSIWTVMFAISYFLKLYSLQFKTV